MATNIFVNLPKAGDAVVGRLSDKKVMFIAGETYDDSALSSTDYERLGAVYARRGRKVKIAWKGGCLGNFQWAARACWKVSSPALSTDAHTWTIRSYASSGSTEKTQAAITFTPAEATPAAYAAALNAAFSDSSQMGDLYAIDFWAYVNDGTLYIESDFVNYKQQGVGTYADGADSEQGLYISATTGDGAVAESLGLAFAIAPDSGTFYDTSTGNDPALRRGRGGSFQGAIGNLDVALSLYGSASATSDWVAVRTEITSLEQAGPMRLSTYQGSYCQLLRDTYEPTEEGKATGTEEGWKRYMKSLTPAPAQGMGAMSDGIDGVEACRSMRGAVLLTGQKTDGTSSRYPLFAQVDKATSGAAAIPPEKWYVPTPMDIADLEQAIDAIAPVIKAMGGVPLAGSTALWSCLRRAATIAWVFGGGNGIVNASSSVSGRCGLVPVSLYELA